MIIEEVLVKMINTIMIINLILDVQAGHIHNSSFSSSSYGLFDNKIIMTLEPPHQLSFWSQVLIPKMIRQALIKSGFKSIKKPPGKLVSIPPNHPYYFLPPTHPRAILSKKCGIWAFGLCRTTLRSSVQQHTRCYIHHFFECMARDRVHA